MVGAPLQQQQAACPSAIGADGTFFAGETWSCHTPEPADPPQKERARGRASEVSQEQRAEDVRLAEQILRQLEEGGDSLAEVAAALEKPGTVRRLSFQAAGCWAVQKALDELDRCTAARLARGLEGVVRQAARSPSANFVVQAIIKALRTDEMSFVLAELVPCAVELAYHESGCRVFCRLLEHHMEDERTVQVLDVVMGEAEWLVRDRYGCHVMEHVLEHGLPRQKLAIGHALCRKLIKNAQDKYAAFVFATALDSWECGGLLAQDLLRHSPRELAATFTKSTGGMVGRMLLKQGEDVAQRLAEKLQDPEAQCRLRESSRGKHFLDLLQQKLDQDGTEPLMG